MEQKKAHDKARTSTVEGNGESVASSGLAAVGESADGGGRDGGNVGDGDNPNATQEDVVKWPWTAVEDDRLVKLVGKFGAKRWGVTASHMPVHGHLGPRRSGRQCRQRWQNYLSPEINKAPWTTQEVHSDSVN